ncbi:microtubule-associated protein 9 isoform X2 [Cynoglossus semilaevis]|uniref:microtubule-associated protein 9 isoform X2 n=1 Tax=Cynoglossus semilaevis TaxID=244447 RepID=UPI000D624E81|nr:microtubule-associated protein 9 isoform X2 [Cynoglossus semilaevis]
MTNQEVRTLAYTKSPKTSKRTTFQDELEAAVSARVSRTKPDPFSYSDDFDEEEDDFLSTFLKSRKKRADAFRSGKTRGKINTFDLSDDEDKPEKTKKVSFLKTQKVTFTKEETSDSQEYEPPDSSHIGHNNEDKLQKASDNSECDTQSKNSGTDHIGPQIPTESSSKSHSVSPSDSTLDLPFDSSVTKAPDQEENTGHPSVPDPHHVTPAESKYERQPRPKPRQRSLALSKHTTEDFLEDAGPPVLSRSQTSSASIHLSTDVSSTTAARSSSPHWTEDDQTASNSLGRSPLSKSEQSLTRSTIDSASSAHLISEDGNEQENVEDHSLHSVDQLSQTQEKSADTKGTHLKTTQRSQSACSKRVESRYLGTLQILDRKVSLQESEPQGAESLRAAIYQEWLKKKKEKSKEKMELKKKEELLQEKKKKDAEAKKEDAVASYEAWKEKKMENLKAKAKEKQDMARKEQQASEEKTERRQSAKQMFEKWKKETDHVLKEKHQKQKDAENKLRLKKQRKEEERRRECVSAFTHWN